MKTILKNISLPPKWEYKRIKYICAINHEVLDSNTNPLLEFDYVDIGSVNYTFGICAKTRVIFENSPSRARRKVCEGDVIVSTVRTYLKAIAPIKEEDKDVIVSTGFAVISPRKLEKAYLAYVLTSKPFVEKIVSESTGVSYPAISPADIGTISIPQPPSIRDQLTIAAYLDDKTSKIQSRISKAERMIELLKEKREALIVRAVTKGLDNSVSMKDSGVAWIGDIPEKWMVGKIGYYYSLKLGKMLQPNETAASDTLEKYLCALNINGTKLRLDTIKEMWFSSKDKDIYRLKRGDLLVVEGGNVGDSALFDIDSNDFYMQNSLHRARNGNKAITGFLKYWLAALKIKGYIDLISNKSTIAHFTKEKFSNSVILIPPLSVQEEIVNYLDAQITRIDTAIEKSEIMIEKLREYQEALITAAVTGQIDIRGETK